MNLEKIVDIFNFAVSRVNSGETYLVNQMHEAIEFLNDMNDSVALPTPVKVKEHPSKSDSNWVSTFQDIINRLMPPDEKIPSTMILNYFNSDDSHLHHYVAQHHLVKDLMGVEVIEMVETAVNNREIKN